MVSRIEAIDGATDETYKLTDDDLGREISVRVTGSLAGYVEAKTGTIKDGASAGIWPEDQCSEPAVKSGVYQISSEKELKWFVNAVNGGNTAINGALTTDIALSTADGAARQTGTRSAMIRTPTRELSTDRITESQAW